MITTWINYHLLSTVVFIPLLLGLILLFVPKSKILLTKTIGLLGTIIHAIFTATSLLRLNPNPIGQIYTEYSPWFTAVGIPVDYQLAVDGLNIWLVLLVIFLMPIAMIRTWTNINRHANAVLTLILTLETGILGILLAQNLMVFYIFWGALQLPFFFLITMHNDAKLKQTATKLMLVVAFGSLSYLMSMLVVAGEAGSFAAEIIAQTLTIMPINTQRNIFLAFVLIFAINIPLLYIYSRIPNAKAKTSITIFVVITVIFLKLSSYGFIRFVLPTFPNIIEHYKQTLATISAITICYGALTAIKQTDTRKLIANLAISQIGLTILGVSSMTTVGIQGALFQIFSNGISVSITFLLVTVLYRKTVAGSIVGSKKAALRMPIFTTLSLLTVACSIGMPLTNSFMGEHMIIGGVLMSSLKWRQAIAYIAISGMTTNAVSMLLMAKRIFWHSTNVDNHMAPNYPLKDLSFKEAVTIVPILLLSLYVCYRPQIFLKQSEQQINFLLNSNNMTQVTKNFVTVASFKLRRQL